MHKLMATVLSVLVFLLAAFAENIGNAYKGTPVKNKTTAKQTIYWEQGKVVHVADGDTITVETAAIAKLKVRLYGIDAPEKAQPYGPQAAGIMKQLVLGKEIKLEVQGTDRYGRKLARVYCDGVDINAKMLEQGAAWHYKRYDTSYKFQAYAELEQRAQKAKKGLWNREKPVAPWDYRKSVKKS